jgi:hypothetical protein
VYDTVRRSFAPVAACFEYDRDRWNRGEAFSCGVWAVNDQWEPMPDARIRWRIEDRTRSIRASGTWDAAMAEDSARKIGDVRWTAAEPGPYTLTAEVGDGSGRRISENVFGFEVAGR